MTDFLRVNDRVQIPLSDLEVRFSRSSGPGGQSVNTSDSRVEVSFNVATSAAIPVYLRDRALKRLDKRLVDGVLTVASSEQRSQFQNRAAAQRRLVAVLTEAMAPPAPARRPTKPTRGSQSRRMDTKTARGQVKKNRGRPGLDD